MTKQTNPAPNPSDTRARLIDTALALFARSGYAKTTTRAIADEAGVNEVTLFRHFGSKKGLLTACVETFNAQGFAATFEREISGDYAADVLLMARLLARSMAENFTFMRLMMCELAQFPEMREIALAGGRGNATLIADYFRRQIAAGVIRADFDPATLAHAFDTLFSTHIFYQNMFDDSLMPDVPDDALIRQLADLFITGTQA